MSETWAWIGGWAISPERLKKALEKALPGTRQIVFHPSPHAVDQLLSIRADYLGAYSLGTLLLLQAIDRLPKKQRIHCLAPILGFCQEDQLGGTTPRSTMMKLRERLASNPMAAIQLFYRLAKLDEEPSTELPYNSTDLEWGLQTLSEQTADKTAIGNNVYSIIGREDPLMKVEQVTTYFEHSHLVSSLHSYKQLVGHLEAASG